MDIIVFQQFGSAEKKITGIGRYGNGLKIKEVVSVDLSLPEVEDFPERYIRDDFECDLVLNYLKHLDLSSFLVDVCEKKGIPVVTTGKQGRGFTPFTCCGLGRSTHLGAYGDQFGFPEYDIKVEDGRIAAITVLRGAPCAATWDALKGVIGMTVEDVLIKLPLQVQQNCVADPSGFDPISGKSPVHYAAYVHLAAIKKALT